MTVRRMRCGMAARSLSGERREPVGHEQGEALRDFVC